MNMSTTTPVQSGGFSRGRGTPLPLQIGALGALIIMLVLVGCEPAILEPAANLQRRIVPAGILLSWDAPAGGEVGGFNVYNGNATLNGAPLGASARSYLVTGLIADSVYTLTLETIFNLDDVGGTALVRVPADPLTFAAPGSAANPWLVDSAEELRSIVTGFRSTATDNNGTDATPLTRTAEQSLAEHYLQIADITLCADATVATCDPFVPIGNDYTDATATDEPFSGSYDGGGNTISGLRVDSEADNPPAILAWGLFGLVSGEIRGVTLQDPAVTGTQFAGTLVGALVGRLEGDVTVADAMVAYSASNGGTVTATGIQASIGGLVGDGFGTIRNSSASVGVSVDNANIAHFVGGLVGRYFGPIIVNSFATGAVNSVRGTGNRVGGLVAHLSEFGEIRNSYATGAVNGGAGSFSGFGGVGGLVGDFLSGTIRNSYATGDVDGGAGIDTVGGLVGSLSAGRGVIRDSYATGTVDGGADASGVADGADTIGGLVGTSNVNPNQIVYSFHSGAVANDDAGDTVNDHGTARTLAQLQCPIGVTCTGAGPFSLWSRFDWDFGSDSELPSLIGTDGVELPGQPVTP